jgi:hypothetical protein
MKMEVLKTQRTKKILKSKSQIIFVDSDAGNGVDSSFRVSCDAVIDPDVAGVQCHDLGPAEVTTSLP